MEWRILFFFFHDDDDDDEEDMHLHFGLKVPT